MRAHTFMYVSTTRATTCGFGFAVLAVDARAVSCAWVYTFIITGVVLFYYLDARFSRNFFFSIWEGKKKFSFSRSSYLLGNNIGFRTEDLVLRNLVITLITNERSTSPAFLILLLVLVRSLRVFSSSSFVFSSFKF